MLLPTLSTCAMFGQHLRVLAPTEPSGLFNTFTAATNTTTLAHSTKHWKHYCTAASFIHHPPHLPMFTLKAPQVCVCVCFGGRGKRKDGGEGEVWWSRAKGGKVSKETQNNTSWFAVLDGDRFQTTIHTSNYLKRHQNKKKIQKTSQRMRPCGKMTMKKKQAVSQLQNQAILYTRLTQTSSDFTVRQHHAKSSQFSKNMWRTYDARAKQE